MAEAVDSWDEALEQLEESELIEEAKTSREAFAVLYRRHLPTVYGYLVRRTGSHDLAEDLTAATFEKAMLAIPNFEWRGAPFGAWLIRIASRKLTDHFRTEARRATDPTDPLSGTPDNVSVLHQASQPPDVDEVVEDAAEIALVLKALDDLPERYKRAIVLRFISELSTEEAAEALGCSKATFAVILHRSIKSLRKAVDRRGQI